MVEVLEKVVRQKCAGARHREWLVKNKENYFAKEESTAQHRTSRETPYPGFYGYLSAPFRAVELFPRVKENLGEIVLHSSSRWRQTHVEPGVHIF